MTANVRLRPRDLTIA